MAIKLREQQYHLHTTFVIQKSFLLLLESTVTSNTGSQKNAIALSGAACSSSSVQVVGHAGHPVICAVVPDSRRLSGTGYSVLFSDMRASYAKTFWIDQLRLYPSAIFSLTLMFGLGMISRDLHRVRRIVSAGCLSGCTECRKLFLELDRAGIRSVAFVLSVLFLLRLKCPTFAPLRGDF